jgi:hypothetical protein
MTIRTSLKMIKLSAVVFASVGVVFVSKYYQSKNQNQKLKEELHLEKIMHSNELNEILSRYDAVLIKNKMLQESKDKTAINQKEAISEMKAQKKASDEQIKVKIASYQKDDGAPKTNTYLKLDSVKNELNQQSDRNKSLTNQLDELSDKYKELQRLNDKNESVIATSKNLTAINVSANGVKIVSNNIIETKKFTAMEQIKVCFTLLENKAAVKGNKDIYIQILDPDNKIVSENGNLLEEQSRLLRFSAKTNIYYDNEELDVCVFVDPNKSDIRKGDYEINIFSGINLIGSTVFSLK